MFSNQVFVIVSTSRLVVRSAVGGSARDWTWVPMCVRVCVCVCLCVCMCIFSKRRSLSYFLCKPAKPARVRTEARARAAKMRDADNLVALCNVAEAAFRIAGKPFTKNNSWETLKDPAAIVISFVVSD